jgi:hypothetical protein
MDSGISTIFIEGNEITLLKGYLPLIHDFTCDEISDYARELNLGCLEYLEGGEDCLFNFSQCQDILMIEIPALRSKSLSKQAQDALNGLEFAIRDTKSAFAFLELEGD